MLTKESVKAEFAKIRSGCTTQEATLAAFMMEQEVLNMLEEKVEPEDVVEDPEPIQEEPIEIDVEDAEDIPIEDEEDPLE